MGAGGLHDGRQKRNRRYSDESGNSKKSKPAAPGAWKHVNDGKAKSANSGAKPIPNARCTSPDCDSAALHCCKDCKKSHCSRCFHHAQQTCHACASHKVVEKPIVEGPASQLSQNQRKRVKRKAKQARAFDTSSDDRRVHQRRRVEKETLCPSCDKPCDRKDPPCVDCKKPTHPGLRCYKRDRCVPCHEKKFLKPVAKDGPKFIKPLAKVDPCPKCQEEVEVAKADKCKVCNRFSHHGCFKDGCYHCRPAALRKEEAVQKKKVEASDRAKLEAAAGIPSFGLLKYLEVNRSEVWPEVLLNECLHCISDNRAHPLPHEVGVFKAADGSAIVAAAKADILSLKNPTVASLHVPSEGDHEDHFATLRIYADGGEPRVEVWDSLDPVHPGIPEALVRLGLAPDRVETKGIRLDTGFNCSQALVNNYARWRLGINNTPEDEVPFSNDDFKSEAAFLARLGLHAKDFEDDDKPPSPVEAPAPEQAPAEKTPAPAKKEAKKREDKAGTKAKPATAAKVKKMRGEIEKAKEEQAKEAPPQAPPKGPPSKKNVGAKPKKATTRRAKGDKVIPSDGVNIPADFPKGSIECLRRAPMSREAAIQISTNPEMRALLMLPLMVILKEESESVQLSTRRCHLYTLKDLLAYVEKAGPGQDRLDEAFINALEAMGKDRNWAPPTLASKAADLFGCLLRLDQYTNLKRINLSQVGSFWKDASKGWLRKVCGHAPTREEVTPEAMTRILKRTDIPLSVSALMTLCWCTTGRPYNWLYVKKNDVVLTRETPEMMEEQAKKRGAEVKAPGFKVKVTWRDHKTLGTRQAFTTHSWVPMAAGEKVRKWYDAVKGEWLFPKSQWTKIKEGVAAALKSENLDWDLKALRRGSLSTMARNDTPLDDLRLFSGHKSEATLLRYLSYGLHAQANATKGEAAARALLPGMEGLDPDDDLNPE